MEKGYMTPIIIIWTLFPLTFFCIFVFFAISFFIGHTTPITPTVIEDNIDIAPNIDTYGVYDDKVYFYIVDKNTGVVYLANHDDGMTVMLNAEGKPVLAQDLGLE